MSDKQQNDNTIDSSKDGVIDFSTVSYTHLRAHET